MLAASKEIFISTSTSLLRLRFRLRFATNSFTFPSNYLLLASASVAPSLLVPSVVPYRNRRSLSVRMQCLRECKFPETTVAERLRDSTEEVGDFVK